MQQEPVISFRQMESSPAVEARVREKIAVLERFHPRITTCRVTVEKDHHARHKGDLFRVRIDIGIPGREIVVDRTGPKNHAHEDVYVALRDAFDAAARQLEDDVRVRRGDVKVHPVPSHGEVIRLFKDDDYGFMRTTDGQEVYFHRHSVVDDAFDRLEVGSQVRVTIAEAEGEQGYQASTVQLVGKHHPTG
jgi:ribosomal subunit interface protein